MNFWKKSLIGGALGVRADTSIRSKTGVLGPKAEGLMTGLLQHTRGIMEWEKQSRKQKMESDFSSLPNGLAELL